MTVEVVEGDLLDQEVDAIVSAWNRNIILGGCCGRMAFRVPSRSAEDMGLFNNCPGAPFPLVRRC